MDTYEIEAKRQRLNEAILASGGSDLSAALEFAAHMSITDVVEALQRNEPNLLFDHSELCDAFIRAWLDQLPPLERFAATAEVSGHPRHQLRAEVRAQAHGAGRRPGR